MVPMHCAPRRVRRGLIVLVAAAALVSACASDTPSRATRGSTFPSVAPVSTFTEIPAPPGAATSPGADHWYRAPAPHGRSVELAVYLPKAALGRPPTALVLHGGDGLRRSHEALARAYAEAGFIGIAGCWFDQPDADLPDDAVSCRGGPTFKGTERGAVADVDALVAAVGQVQGVDLGRLGIVGHSYGGAIALMRASDDGVTEPIVAASAPFAPKPTCCRLRRGDRYPIDHVETIGAPVLAVQGRADVIVPVGQAERFAKARAATGVLYYAAPANHAFPWQVDQFPGEPVGTTFASKFVTDSVAWLRARLP